MNPEPFACHSDAEPIRSSLNRSERSEEAHGKLREVEESPHFVEKMQKPFLSLRVTGRWLSFARLSAANNSLTGTGRNGEEETPCDLFIFIPHDFA